MDHNSSGTNWGNAAAGTTFTAVDVPSQTELLSGGLDGTDSTDGELKAGYELFNDADTVDVGLIIGGKCDATHIDNLITIAENRKDCNSICITWKEVMLSMLLTQIHKQVMYWFL